MIQDINELIELVNQLAEAGKKKDYELYQNTAKKLAEKARSLEKLKKSKKVIFYKKKHLRKSKIRVRVINKVVRIAKMPLIALKNLKNKITSKVRNIGNKITEKVNNVKVKLQEKKNLINRNKKRIVGRIRVIKRVSKKNLSLLKKQIEVKKNSVGFTNLRQKATIAGLTVENLALRGAVASKNAINNAKVEIIDKKNVAKKQIRRKYNKAKRVIKHATVDQVKKLKENIVGLKNNAVTSVKYQISDKRKVAGRIKLKISRKVTKVKTVSIERLKELKKKIKKGLSFESSYKGSHYADSSESRRRAMQEHFKNYLNATKEGLSKNEEKINLMRAQKEQLLNEFRGAEIEAPVRSK